MVPALWVGAIGVAVGAALAALIPPKTAEKPVRRTEELIPRTETT
jgi:hypothetical protein